MYATSEQKSNLKTPKIIDYNITAILYEVKCPIKTSPTNSILQIFTFKQEQVPNFLLPCEII